MSQPIARVRLHRFHDLIAFDAQTGTTEYLTPELARALSAALVEFADDCERVKFTASTLATRYIPPSEETP